jgi:hypothetical protein
MPISGLVITLSPHEELAAQAVATLSARPEFMPGERNARWLPVDMESRDDDGSRDLHGWLNALPGVDFVDVVYVNFDEDEATASLTSEVNHEH